MSNKTKLDMQREIKFRAWDKKEKRMTDSFSFEDIDGEEGNEGYIQAGGHRISSWGINQGRYLFLQFTGRHDKKGKEIFEGDVIGRWLGPNTISSGSEFVVEWDEEGAGWNLIENSHLIIGNKFENPELLEVVK